MTVQPPEVILYGRPGCHLCDDARTAIGHVRERCEFELVELDIEQDEVLLKAYLERIPVVTVDGTEAFQYFVDEVELRRQLDEAWNRRRAQVE